MAEWVCINCGKENEVGVPLIPTEFKCICGNIAIIKEFDIISQSKAKDPPKLKYDDLPRIEEDYYIKIEYPNYFIISRKDYRCSSIIIDGEITEIDESQLGEILKEELLRLNKEMITLDQDKIKKIEDVTKFYKTNPQVNK